MADTPRPLMYSETLKDGLWVADEIDTFVRSRPELGSKFQHMAAVQLPEEATLWELLCMGAVTRVPPRVYSFPQKKLPHNASEAVAYIYGISSVLGYPANYLTIDQLETKAVELLLAPEDHALAVRGHLMNLLRNLEKYPGPSMHRRIVFWFIK